MKSAIDRQIRDDKEIAKKIDRMICSLESLCYDNRLGTEDRTNLLEEI